VPPPSRRLFRLKAGHAESARCRHTASSKGDDGLAPRVDAQSLVGSSRHSRVFSRSPQFGDEGRTLGIRGSAGGRANEGGSQHRAGVGAFVAVHALSGRPLTHFGYDLKGPIPIDVLLETETPVDDLTCTLSDGSRLFVQAKRSCGQDQPLRDTVKQWVAQLDSLGPDDRVALAVRNLTGRLKELPAALKRRRAAQPGVWSSREREALRALEKSFPADTTPEVRCRVLDHAVVAELWVESPSDPGTEIAAALLESGTVRRGSGFAGFFALLGRTAALAAQARGATVDDWLGVLAAANVEVLADGFDGPGAARRAQLDALVRYRQRLAAEHGRIDYRQLAEDVPPLEDPGLVTRLLVTMRRPEQDERDTADRLIEVARARSRLLLVGLPGAGKSTALHLLSAYWASDPTAPCPVLVRLPDLVRPGPPPRATVTLDLLLEAGTRDAPTSDREMLRSALRRAAETGQIVLMLDGLDECLDARAEVAQGLAELAGLHPDAGLLLSTRASGLPAAMRLKLPTAWLVAPLGLDRMHEQLLAHVAAHRLQPAEQEQWIAAKSAAVASAMNSAAVREVPLFATLLTLSACERDAADMPRGAGPLLEAVVRDSVRRWELVRLDHRPGRPVRARQLTPDLLLDGFAAIAHALAGSVEPSYDVVRDAAGDVLREQWGASPGAAQELADDVLWFWDEHVGVFVQEGGRIRARVRQFTEVGDAMWVSACPDRVETWLQAALQEEDKRETVLLARSLDQGVSAALVRRALSPRDCSDAREVRAVAWLVDAVSDGASLPHEAASSLIDRVAQCVVESASTAAQPTSESQDGPTLRDDLRRDLLREEAPSWWWTLRLCQLPAPPDLRGHRDRTLSQLQLSDDHHAVAAALAVLADLSLDQAADACASPGDRQLDVLHRLVYVSVPEHRTSPSGVDRGSQFVDLDADRAPELIAGHEEAFVGACEILSELDDEAISNAKRIAGRFRSLTNYSRLQEALAPAGVILEPLLGADATRVGALVVATRAADRRFLRALAELSQMTTERTPPRWRYSALADFYAVTANFLLSDVRPLADEDIELLTGWARAFARAADINLDDLAEQARDALRTLDDRSAKVHGQDIARLIPDPPLILAGGELWLAGCGAAADMSRGQG